MCGLAGIISKEGSSAPGGMESAVNSLQHRGPQGRGIWTNPSQTAALGHCRLSIIDLSPSGAQPMHYLDRYTIIHNGELYNYIEIREELKKNGFSFNTWSDTEVIVAAYAAWGTACLQQFDGMFAFAIWDEKERTLFAARDRFGEKPFYYACRNGLFCFASELKALWQLGVPKKLNRAMLYNFLTIGYTDNPHNPKECFYDGVRKLPAASFLLFSPKDLEPKVEKYWQVYNETNPGITEKEAVEKFSSLFSESIKKRLRSDVPVGTSLSGGLDSSSIVAFCDRYATDQYSHFCFTASFRGSEKDETAYAKNVAGQFGLHHCLMEMDENGLVALMEEVMRFQDEPFSSSSVLAQYKVFGLAKEKGVSVLLDGQGADEVLAGYRGFYKWFWQELYRDQRLEKSMEMRAAIKLGVHEEFSLKNKAAALFPHLAAEIHKKRKKMEASRHTQLAHDFIRENKNKLYYALPEEAGLNGVLYFHSFVHGLEELLRVADRNSMAHGVEVRLPFLSHELVHFLFTLPPEMKIHKGWTKWVLRRAVADFLPVNITWRRDKTAFEPPQKKWMENKEVQEAIRLGKKKLADHGILDPASVKKIQPHDAYAAESFDWKFWSASYLL